MNAAPQADLRLAVAHVAAQQSVHNLPDFKSFNPSSIAASWSSVSVNRSSLELVKQRVVRAVAIALALFSLAVKLGEVDRELADGFSNFFLDFRKVRAAYLRQLWFRAVGGIARQRVHVFHGDVQLVVPA